MNKLLPAALHLSLALSALFAAPVADVAKVHGQVDVLSTGEWDPAILGQDLTIKDEIRTGASSSASILYRDNVAGAQATRIDLAPNSHVALQQFELATQHPPKRVGFLSMLKGAARTIARGWKGGSVFATKAGSVVCGVRGSEVLINRDETGELIVMLGGDVFKFHWEDDDRAAEVSELIAASSDSGDLAANSEVLVNGVKVTKLGPNYAALVSENAAGLAIQEVTLADAVIEKLRGALDGLTAGEDATGLDFSAQLNEALRQVTVAVSQSKPRPIETPTSRFHPAPEHDGPFQRKVQVALAALRQALDAYETGVNAVPRAGPPPFLSPTGAAASDAERLAAILSEAEGILADAEAGDPAERARRLPWLQEILTRLNRLEALLDR